MAAESGGNANQTTVITGVSNRDFLERFAQAGRLGLCGGATTVDLAIRRAQRHVAGAGRWSDWSHAFLFEGARADGLHWVIESDLQFHRRHIQLGVQENRMTKYFDEKMFPNLAVLDFGLDAAQVAALLREGLELVAGHERYSLRELVGTLIALRRPGLRGRENVLARERSTYCSAFVQQLFRKAGLELAPGVGDKNTTPEDIARTPVPHVTWLLQRQVASGKNAGFRAKLKSRVQARIRRIKRRRK
jgi:hypothetical protein